MRSIESFRRPDSAQRRVTVDWSDLFTDSSDATIDSLIEWVRTYPQRKDIHVYLPSVRQCTSGSRLQRMLQSLGCRVTMKVYGAAA